MDVPTAQDGIRILEAAGRGLLGLLRITAAGLLAYVFVVVLMIASAQSAAIAVLERLDSHPDYNATYQLLLEDDAWRMERGVRQERLRHARNAAKDAELRRDAVQRAYRGEIAPLQALMSRMADAKVCDLAHEPIPPEGAVLALQLADQCAGAEATPERFRAETNDVLSGRAAIIRAANAALREARVADSLYGTAAETKADFDTFVAERPKLDIAVRSGLAGLQALRNHRLLGSGLLLDLPPTLMHILLAFLSGLFGGLLVTLVLVVYPNTDVDITTSGSGPGARVILGGLISVSVFIVLGSGAAVLGAGNSFSDGSANYLAFSGIGVLAGMFSDRVAKWLSERANVFFQNQPQSDGWETGIAAGTDGAANDSGDGGTKRAA